MRWETGEAWAANWGAICGGYCLWFVCSETVITSLTFATATGPRTAGACVLLKRWNFNRGEIDTIHFSPKNIGLHTRTRWSSAKGNVMELSNCRVSTLWLFNSIKFVLE